jgi:hypothetical protein
MKVEIITRPNRLKAKVSGGTGGATGTIAAELAANAQDALQKYAKKYPEQADIDLTRLIAAATAVKATKGESGGALGQLRREAAEIMGQGETFGFVLLTRFARSLYDFCGGLNSVSSQQAEFLQAHIDAITLIIRGRITGQGGEVGQELIRSLALAARKLAASAPPS